MRADGRLSRHHPGRHRPAARCPTPLRDRRRNGAREPRPDLERKQGSTVYRPKIRVRYTVGGTEFVSERYTFDSGSTSGGDYARRAVQSHLPGGKVPVYYDPAHPETAILELEVPPTLWFMLLFLQPFLVVALALGWGLFRFFPHRRRVRRFLESSAAFPWTIPSWGTMESREGVYVIEYRTARSSSIAAAYFLATFLASVVLAFGFQGFSHPSGRGVAGAFATSAAVAVAGGLALRARGRREVRLDPVLRELQVAEAKGSRAISFHDIQEFVIDRPMVCSRGRSRRGSHRLVVRLKDGQGVKLHEFTVGDLGAEIARKAGTFVADTASAPLRVSL